MISMCETVAAVTKQLCMCELVKCSFTFFLLLTAPVVYLVLYDYKCRDHLGRRNFVLNYQDNDGDLIEMVDQSDLDTMHHERLSCKQQASWTFHLTELGDHTPYHTHPYR